MSAYITNDTKTMLLMNQARWYDTLKHIHDFDETHPLETRYDLLFQADDIMKKLEIKYWLTNGSALGLVRDDQLIPWDDDIDIDVYSEDLVPNFHQMVMSLVNSGFICRAVERGATSKVSAFKDNFKISISGIYLEDNFRRSKFRLYPKEFFENSVEYKIKDRVFNIPGPVDEYLSFIYKDWKTPLKANYVQADFLNNRIPMKYNKKEN